MKASTTFYLIGITGCVAIFYYLCSGKKTQSINVHPKTTPKVESSKTEEAKKESTPSKNSVTIKKQKVKPISVSKTMNQTLSSKKQSDADDMEEESKWRRFIRTIKESSPLSFEQICKCFFYMWNSMHTNLTFMCC